MTGDPWPSYSQSGRYNDDYLALLCDGATHILSGSITVHSESAIYACVLAQSDAAQMDVQVGPLSKSWLASDPLDLGLSKSDVYGHWVYVYVGIVQPGTHAVQVQTFDVYPNFAYLDAIVATYPLALDNGVGADYWWESDHPYILRSGPWYEQPSSGSFPSSVVTQTGAKSVYAGIGGVHSSILYAAINLPAAGDLVITGTTAPDGGIAEVWIDGVLQSTWDMYSSATRYRQKTAYTTTGGYHAVMIRAMPNKNAASTGNPGKIEIDALSGVSYNGVVADGIRLQRLADYCSGLVRVDDGGVRIAYDASIYNQDNDAGYLLFAMAHACSDPRLSHVRAATRRGLQWLYDIQDIDGAWHWGYQRGAQGGYTPYVSSYYAGLGITDIKLIDAAQSVPCAALYFYGLHTGDREFVATVKWKFIRGVDALISNNYDPTNKMFMSSWQNKPGSGGWQLLDIQYSAGQADVWVGLMAAWMLSGDRKYKTYADDIRSGFDLAFWSSTLSLYSIGLSGSLGGAKTKDNATKYMFAQGWANWVFPPIDLANGTNALNTIVATWIEPDTYSVKVPGSAEAETANSAWLTLGLLGSGAQSSVVDAMRERLRQYQMSAYPSPGNGHGAALFSSAYPYAYGSTSAWWWLALAQQPRNTWPGVADKLFVVITSYEIFTSVDLNSFTPRDPPMSNVTLLGGARGESSFVAVGKRSFSPSSYRLFSSTGQSWEASSGSFDDKPYSAAYGLGRYIAVGQKYTGGPYPSTGFIASTDGGQTWTAIANSGSPDPHRIIYTDRFVAVARISGSPGVWQSTDGVSFSFAAISVAQCSDLCFGSGIYLIVNPGIRTSTDLVSWPPSTYSMPDGSEPRSCAYGGGVFIVGGRLAGSAVQKAFVLRSTDSVTWTSISIPNMAWPIVSLSYLEGIFLAGTEVTGQLIASYDHGLSWVEKTMPANNGIVGFAHG